MLDQSEVIDLEEAVPADPYDGVALGVECAWPESIQLARGSAVPVRDGAGRTVYAHAGRVWITEEKGTEDVVL